jgi:heme o synthase
MAIAESFAAPRITTVGDFFALLKPRVMSLVIFTGLAGIIVAPGHVNVLTGFTALLCVAIAAGASGALNMAYDSDIDGLMTRTATRPIPLGHISRDDAMAFGWSLAFLSVAIMWLFVNLLAASLLAFTVFVYIGVYTLWLKRRTPQNIVIGGLAGALPPAIGWASVTGSLSLAPLVLVAIIFMWTPPHFWALSLWRSEDYARAGIPMMPVVKGKPATRRLILIYTMLLAPLGVLPAFIGLGGIVYLVSAASMGFWMLLEAFATWRERDTVKEPSARRLFGVSLLYVFVPFAALIVERLLHLSPLWT